MCWSFFSCCACISFEKVVGNDDVPELNRTVTIYASGSVTVNGALEPSTITIKQDDIRQALGVEGKQWVPPLSGAKISHYFNPTNQRLGITVTGKSEQPIVQDAAMARDPFQQKMRGFTAVIPSVTQVKQSFRQCANPLLSCVLMN